MWSFAIVNNRLAEIYFDVVRGKMKVTGHCYVKKEEFTTKREQQHIEKDTKRYCFVYRNGIYKRIAE